MPTVSAHVAVTLAAHVDHVFGVMGNGNAYFLDAIERIGVRFTPVRHEAGVLVVGKAGSTALEPAATWRGRPATTARSTRTRYSPAQGRPSQRCVLSSRMAWV